MKSILVIGLGRFGTYLTKELSEMGNEVMVVDSCEQRVNEILPFVVAAQIGDATREDFLASLDIPGFDLCIVAIGDHFQSSLETTSLLKDMGANIVLARAGSDVHAKLLLRNGADQVIYAEKEVARRIAIKYGSDNIFDFIELSLSDSICEISVPEKWIGETIVGKQVRTRYGISILATKKGETIRSAPQPEYRFTRDETLIIMGKNKDIKALFA